MLKKDITYKDLDDNDVTETFWFNISKAEMAEMALEREGKDGGFEQWLKTMIESNDGAVLTATFKKILLSTIGERSADNKRFIKNDEIRDNFLFSDAYSVLFMELLTDADKMSAFINGVMPKDMQGAAGVGTVNTPDISTVTASEPGPQPITTQFAKHDDDVPQWVTDGRAPTADELKGAKPEHITLAFQRRGQQGS